MTNSSKDREGKCSHTNPMIAYTIVTEDGKCKHCGIQVNPIEERIRIGKQVSKIYKNENKPSQQEMCEHGFPLFQSCSKCKRNMVCSPYCDGKHSSMEKCNYNNEPIGGSKAILKAVEKSTEAQNKVFRDSQPPKSSEPKKDEGEWRRDWLLFWGIAPIGSLKYKKGVDILHFIEKLLSSQEERIRKEIKKKIKKLLVKDTDPLHSYMPEVVNETLEAVLTSIEEKGGRG